MALGQLLTIDIALKIASVAETVEVTGGSPLIDVRQDATFATLQRDSHLAHPEGA